MIRGRTHAKIALDVPISDLFDYRIPDDMQADLLPGHWVLVPWGTSRRVGIVVELTGHADLPAERVRDLLSRVADGPPADPAWIRFARFAADYYHRTLGEVLLPAIPKLLRTPPAARARGSVFDRARKRQPAETTNSEDPTNEPPTLPLALNARQADVLTQLQQTSGYRCLVLHGITGSGKTEVYLQWIAALLQQPGSQVLVLVPEIGLTPQLVRQFRRRFPQIQAAVLHSDLPDGERAAHWLAAADGTARVIIGTRLAVLAPLPRLVGLIVDEEHDPSYKQQEGVRYSARDLAIALASQRDIPILLGSATPALETWHATRTGRYQLLSLPERATGAALPRLQIVGLKGQALQHGITDRALTAARAALEREQQVLVFLNRRGYAPVLNCEQCGWMSQCDTCSAYRVLHRLGVRPNSPDRYRLICHHCAADQPVPRTCPTCGNLDLNPVGRGTQRIEQGLAELFPQARIARLDRDVARRRGAAESVLAKAHAGEVDILVGTQMLAKGHDFSRLSLVIVVDADGGLYSADFRAPERLFATLMQVAGRAGRSRSSGIDGQVIVQTRFPAHPLFAALEHHDYPGFANRLLEEREASELPPFVHQALLRAESRTLQTALDWLARMKQLGQQRLADLGLQHVNLFDPVPMAMMRIANTERAQLLIESASRKALHHFVAEWLAAMSQSGTPPGLRWQLDIDPLEI